MPASLISAKIRGVRSFSTSNEKAQSINFTPLTLIVGANGSGKTSIIESLKFIISGDEPPLSDSRRNFINSTKKDSTAAIELHFENFKGELCHAKREIVQPARGAATPGVLSSYKVGSRTWVNVHKQDEWSRTIPRLFNLPNHAILNYVILCHQELNSWCMGDSHSVKQIFDKIFGCEQYKKEIKHIQAEIKTCKNDIALGEKELLFYKEKVNRKVQITFEVEQLTADIKSKSSLIETLDTKLSELKTRKESLISDIKKANENTSSLTNLKKKAADILETSERDLLQSKCDQTEIEDNLSSKLQKISISVNEVQSEYKSMLKEIQTKESLVNKFSNQLSRADPLSKDLTHVQGLIVKMMDLTREIPGCSHLTKLNALIEEAFKVIGNLVSKHGQDNLNEISAELETEKAQIKQIKDQLEPIKAREKLLNLEKSRVEEEYSKVRGTAKAAHNKVMFIKTARCKLANSKSQSMRVDLIEEDVAYIQSIIVSCSIQEVVRELEAVTKELTSLIQDIKKDSHLPDLESKLENVRSEELHLRDDRSMLIGSKSQMERELDRLKAELKTHSNSHSKYAESLGKIACNKIIMKDLESLNTCFQHSITTFHNQMIIKINDVLKARWRHIYKGSDIDYIELIDEEIKKGNDKSAYNYYVGMCKSGVRMKMREKSSAGQRALASIILRMTLAELFVKDLGFMALDEPTANLDAANAESLAEAIGIYVKRRIKSGLNLQWIIITHSEKFLEKLDADCTEYFKVHLDDQNCSTITKTSYQNLSSSERSSIE